VISELYKAGKVKEDLLGTLAKTIICAKTGCLATGPEVVFGNVVLQLAESIILAPKPQTGASTKQRPTTKTEQKAQRPTAAKAEQKEQKPAAPPPAANVAKVETEKKEAKEPPPQTETKKPLPTGEARPGVRWEELVSILAREAKVDGERADAVLAGILDYLSVYPSVGVLRLIEDVARKAKADPRVVRTALEVLRGIDVVEMKEEGVVNLKKLVKRGGTPL